MRIAFVVSQYPPHVTAGLGRYAEAIAPYISRRHPLTVLTVNPGNLPVEEVIDGVTVLRPQGGLLRRLMGRRRNRTRRVDFLALALHAVLVNVRYVALLRRMVRRDQLDLLVVHDTTNFVAASVCHHVLGIPFVLHVHTSEHTLAPRLSVVTDRFAVFSRIERHIGKIARRVIVATPEMREQLVAAGWNADTIDVIALANPLENEIARLLPSEVDARAAALRHAIGVPDGGLILLYVGRLDPLKGVPELLAALPAVVTAHPATTLALLGEGDRTGVEEAARQATLSDHIFVSDSFVSRRALVDWYAAADLCVFPSHYEPFGLVALEAMALARPVVLGPGFSTCFLGDGAAAVVQVDQLERLADPLIALLGSAAARSALGERAAALVQERFTWERTATETLAAYEVVLRATSSEQPH